MPRCESRQQQVQAELDQLQRQQQQIQQELVALDSQTQAETRGAEGAIAAAQAQLDLRQRSHREQQTTVVADLREANAAVQFAREELNRYRQLADTGALADLQLKEKEAALETALARLDRTQGRLNPSAAAIDQAAEEMRQTQARGESTLATLSQTQQALTRQQTELEQQIQARQHTLQHVKPGISPIGRACSRYWHHPVAQPTQSKPGLAIRSCHCPNCALECRVDYSGSGQSG